MTFDNEVLPAELAEVAAEFRIAFFRSVTARILGRRFIVPSEQELQQHTAGHTRRNVKFA
jgi:hypothetical protein